MHCIYMGISNYSFLYLLLRQPKRFGMNSIVWLQLYKKYFPYNLQKNSIPDQVRSWPPIIKYVPMFFLQYKKY